MECLPILRLEVQDPGVCRPRSLQVPGKVLFLASPPAPGSSVACGTRTSSWNGSLPEWGLRLRPSLPAYKDVTLDEGLSCDLIFISASAKTLFQIRSQSQILGDEDRNIRFWGDAIQPTIAPQGDKQGTELRADRKAWAVEQAMGVGREEEPAQEAYGAPAAAGTVCNRRPGLLQTRGRFVRLLQR